MSEEYRKLSSPEVIRNLRKLTKWKLLKGKIHREYKFETFEDAISFMVRSSLEVAKLDHHPEWFNVYDKVVVDLVTHDVDGISDHDFVLATKLERIGAMFGVK